MTTQQHKFEQLLDLVDGRLPEDEVPRLTAEIEADTALAADHEWARTFRAMSQGTTLVPAPARTRAMLEDLLPQSRPFGRAVRQLQEVIATLVLDVTAGPRFAGARGLAVGSSKRQLLFGAGVDSDVTVDLEFTAGTLRVSGQLLADDVVATVSLTGDQSVAQFATNGSGEFSGTIPMPTSAQLSIITASQHIHIDLTAYLEPVGPARHGAT